MTNRTLKVLIADDELRVCRLILTLGKWEEYNMEVIATASNGIEALEGISRYKPDLVITDIRMPGLDGLQVIKKSKEVNPDIEFLVVSGYKHFDFAQSAIKLGVSNYLTKPIKPEELNHSLKVIHRNFFKKSKTQLEIIRSRQIEMEFRSKMRRDNLLNALLNKKNSLNTEQFNLKGEKIQLAFIKIDGVNEIEESHHITSNVEKAFYSHMKQCQEWEFVVMEGKYLLLLNYKEGEEGNIKQRLTQVIDDVLSQKKILRDIKVTIGLSKVENNHHNLFEQLVEARASLNQRLIFGCNQIIEYNNYGPEKQALLRQEMKGYMKDLSRGVEAQSIDDILFAFKKMEGTIREGKGLTGTDILMLIHEIIDFFARVIQKRGLYHLDEKDEEKLKDIKENFHNYFDLDSLFAYVETSLLSFMNELIKKTEEQESLPILKAKQFIQDFYFRPITLELVSQEVGFSTSYFSAQLKKSTGITFTDYLLETRMDQSKKRLRETRKTIAIICDEVGYTDLKSFSKTFKKNIGLTPKEYRKIYSKELVYEN